MLSQVVNHLVRDEKHRKLARDYILKIKRNRSRKYSESDGGNQILP